MSSDHSRLVEGYCALYREYFKEPYIFSGGKDGIAVKRLLSAGVTVDRALTVARESFSRSGYPWDNASSMAGLVSSWSVIVAALAKIKSIPKVVNKFEVRQQLDAVKALIAKHPHNEESVYHNPLARAELNLVELRTKLHELQQQLVGV